ncbi:GNAT family N-acetyltransferase [Candidatus Shapirobacteria bacterium]|nr:GNAT family N-acetyltransferase [Candidatus Shapirobacteria bacterium]
MDIKLELNPSDSQVNDVLGTVWGEKSVIGKIHKQDGDKTLVAVLTDNGKNVGCAAVFIHPWGEIELGSLAIIPEHRGLGLVKHLVEWRANVILQYLKDGYTITTFATIGSDVTNFIHDSMAKMCSKKCLALNMICGAVEVDLKKATLNLEQKTLIPLDKNINLNSTIQISQLPETVYADLNKYPIIAKYTNNFFCLKEKVLLGKNQLIQLPINLDIYILRNNDVDFLIEMIPKYNQKRSLKVSIPLQSSFQAPIKQLKDKKYFVGGVSISDNFLFVDFIVNPNPRTLDIVGNLINSKIPEISLFGKFIEEINSDYFFNSA